MSGSEPGRLGIIDWGIGGLGVLREVDRLRPDVAVVYASDTGFTPYGLVPTRALAARLAQLVDELADHGCTQVVLACNAASTVVDRLQGAAVPVEGIIGHGIAAVPADLRGRLGVVAGRRTIASGAYRRALTTPERTVTSRVAQPLSAHIEAGRTGSDGFVADLRRIVAPLRGADAVLLACTHYPAAAPWFAAELPGTLLLDPAQRCAESLAARWPAGDGAQGLAVGARTYLTSGDPVAMRAAARAAWDLDLGPVGQLRSAP